jgi:hypothetical protein
MTGAAGRPLLFLDVDGPLIPFGIDPARHRDGLPASQVPEANPLLARLDPEHGRRLSALPCELVWATTWMADANSEIAPRIGLPELPVVVWASTTVSASPTRTSTPSNGGWRAHDVYSVTSSGSSFTPGSSASAV